MEQIKKGTSVNSRNLQAISAFFADRADSEQTETFAETAAQSMEHREMLSDYIKAHTDPTLLYREKNQVDSEKGKKDTQATPMDRARRKNKDISMPVLDIYQYFTDRGGMMGDTVMENRPRRLEGMAFLAANIARKQSPYERQSNEVKTQSLIRSADSAEHLVKDKEKNAEAFTVKERTQTLKNCEKLADDATQPQRRELAQLRSGAIDAEPSTLQGEKEAKPQTKNTTSIESTEDTKSIAKSYLARTKKKDSFLNLGNMVYQRDRDKVNRLTQEDYSLETGKAAALLVLEHFRSEDKTLAEILRINEGQATEDDAPPPVRGDGKPEDDNMGGEDSEQQAQ